MNIKIIIAGDFCPQNRVASLINKGHYEEVLHEVKPVLGQSDYSIVNLEAPIVEGPAKPIEKTGPNLKCSANIIDAIKYVGFQAITLANNHFYDYGEAGARTTLEKIENAGFDHVGAGFAPKGASKILYKIIANESFAFINCCEHEFSVVTENSTGCNPLDTINIYNSIHEAKCLAKHVIVIVHGGIEMYQLPTPRMTKVYRFFIEAGADAVINHHQHCFSGYEIYKDKPIVYGLGNFCFDWKGRRNSIWNEGYMACLNFSESGIIFAPIPYTQCDELPSVLLSSINKEQFEIKLRKLCDTISDKCLLLKEYELFLDKTNKSYDIITPYSCGFFQSLYNRGLLPSLISRKKLIRIMNTIKCESHRERLIDSLLRKTK